jgi:hypothetical protein
MDNHKWWIRKTRKEAVTPEYEAGVISTQADLRPFVSLFDFNLFKDNSEAQTVQRRMMERWTVNSTERAHNVTLALRPVFYLLLFPSDFLIIPN